MRGGGATTHHTPHTTNHSPAKRTRGGVMSTDPEPARDPDLAARVGAWLAAAPSGSAWHDCATGAAVDVVAVALAHGTLEGLILYQYRAVLFARPAAQFLASHALASRPGD